MDWHTFKNKVDDCLKELGKKGSDVDIAVIDISDRRLLQQTLKIAVEEDSDLVVYLTE